MGAVGRRADGGGLGAVTRGSLARMTTTKQAWPADAIERRSVASLIPYARNPRTHSPEQVAKLAASIREWGWTTPILIAESGMIIAGHGRLLAAQSLGIEDVPCMVAKGWSKAQIQAYVIADNRLALDAGWDFDLLKVELDDLNGLDFEMDLLGFDVDELSGLMGLAEQAEPTEVEETPTPEVQETVVSERGQVWQLGRHLVMCGDYKDAAFPVVDLLYTDPPYGVNVVPPCGKIGGSVMAENATYAPVHGDDEPPQLSEFLSMGRSVLIWGANYFADQLPSRGQWLVWDKGRPEGTTFSDAELAWTNRDGIAVKVFRNVWHGMIREGESGPRCHPTQKPVKLTADTMGLFDGSTVADPFLGSGTTLIAAEQLGRTCYGIEIEPRYVDVVIRRWQQLTGEKATLESSGEVFPG